MQVKAYIKIQNAVGEQVVVQQLPFAHRAQLTGDLLGQRLQVAQFQRGDGRQRLRAVGGLLTALQFLRRLRRGRQRLRVHARCRLIQACAFILRAALCQMGVRLQNHRHAVGVVHKQVPRQAFQHALPFGQPRLQRRQRGFQPQRPKGVFSIQPQIHRAQHHRQPARVRAGVVFAQRKFHAVQGRAHGFGVKALLRQTAQRVQNQGFHRVRVLGVDPFQPYRKKRLAQTRIQAAAGQIFA